MHMFSSILDSTHDVLVTGAAANVALKGLANLGFARVGIVLEQLVGGHNHARGAETALEAMFLPEALLNGMQATFSGQSLDSGYFSTISLDCKHGAGFDSLIIEHDYAGTTL